MSYQLFIAVSTGQQVANLVPVLTRLIHESV